MLNCNKCSKPAQWRITMQSKDFGTGRGGAQRNSYGCDDHKNIIKEGFEKDIARDEEACGNPFYPHTSILGFGEVIIIPYRG